MHIMTIKNENNQYVLYWKMDPRAQCQCRHVLNAETYPDALEEASRFMGEEEYEVEAQAHAEGNRTLEKTQAGPTKTKKIPA